MKKLLTVKAAIIAVVAITVGITLVAVVNNTRLQTRIFSDDRVLLELWSTYKKNMLEKGTSRTLDKSQANITTSEGQSYTMLRAVWMDDRETFDASWQWTKDNLQRPDKLMSWRFGLLPNGKYGVQTFMGGNNSAADGDSDIAFSLVMAYKRWKDPKYLYDATPIIQGIWENEVVLVNGKPVLAANNLEKNNLDRLLVNPSYLAPYTYKSFAEADVTHDWRGLADNSYAVLQGSMKATFDVQTSAQLPPNWFYMDRTTGAMSASTVSTIDTHYGYDAIRTPWRLALDWEWYKDPRDMQLLEQFGFLADEWQKHGTLNAVYGHDGKTISSDQAPAVYGANLGYFIAVRPDLAKQIYEGKLLPLYNADKQSWRSELAYYNDNWVWFGMALYNHYLPNLAEDKS